VIARKPLEPPPAVARAFVDAMNDYFAETDKDKRGAIAAHQPSVLGQYQSPREKALRLSDVRLMFEQTNINLGTAGVVTVDDFNNPMLPYRCKYFWECPLLRRGCFLYWGSRYPNPRAT
jgi:hypothetical protein